MRAKRIGVLTGGGDAPGLNPAIKALVEKCAEAGIGTIGIYDGWHGLLNGYSDETMELNPLVVRKWDRDGGTNIGASRTNPFKTPLKEGEPPADRSQEVLRNVERLELDGVVAMGGEDTLGAVAYHLSQMGLPVVGIPKTIDNDLPGTDYTLGFDTALSNAMEVIERARTPAGSHHWVQVIEVMGRHTGHLALWSGVAGGAQMVLIPEVKFQYRRIYQLLNEQMELGKRDRRAARYAIVVVSEGASALDEAVVTVDTKLDPFGHARLGGIGSLLSERIRRETPYDSRALQLGHAQRGGTPSAVDRIMGRLFGARAGQAVEDNEFGTMVSARGVTPACTLSLVDLKQAAGKLRTLDVDRFYDASRYFAKL
ncbi:MAG: ATP-dependent 6-phosphofructokinase [Chloroflexi bacterium]|nr:ATP-dependent 6-phosphofructokinase [Chloroflexota bacterium]